MRFEPPLPAVTNFAGLHVRDEVPASTVTQPGIAAQLELAVFQY